MRPCVIGDDTLLARVVTVAHNIVTIYRTHLAGKL